MTICLKPFVTTFTNDADYYVDNEVSKLIEHFKRANTLLKATYIGFGKAEIDGVLPTEDLHYYLFSANWQPNSTYISTTGQRLIKKYKKMILHNGGKVE
ncbi:MAG: hypothetical protein AABY22_00975 [Nanoarchaeota archaeon]